MTRCRKGIRGENPKICQVGVLKDDVYCLENVVVGCYLLKGIRMSLSRVSDLQASVTMELGENVKFYFFNGVFSFQSSNK